MKKFVILSAMLCLGTLSLARAVPTPTHVPEKEKGPAPIDQLAPKMVKLNLTNVSVLDAIAELTKQSGYNIQIQGDRTVLANRKITLQTGEVSFFQAFDQLCVKGGLLEVSMSTVVRPNPLPVPRPVPNPGVQPNVRPALPPGAGQAQPGVQIQPAQIQPGVKIQPRPIRFYNQFTVMDGTPLQLPTCYAGALRIRLLPQANFNMPNQPGETTVVFEVTVEPRVQSFSILGTPAITKAVDDQGQELTVAQPVFNVPGVQPLPAPVPAPRAGVRKKIQPAIAQPALAQPAIAQPALVRYNNLQRIVTVRLKRGEKAATAMKELAGKLTVQFISQPEPVATIDNVLKAKPGQMAKSKNNDVTVILNSIEKVGDIYRAQITMEHQLNVPVKPAGGGGFGVPNPLPPQPAPGGIRGGAIQPAPGPNGVQPPNVQPGAAQAQIKLQAQVQVPQAAVAFPPAVPYYSPGLPTLVDAQGKAYQISLLRSGGNFLGNGVRNQIYNIEFRADAGQGPPDRLVLSQTRLVQVQVPFTFKNVPMR